MHLLLHAAIVPALGASKRLSCFASVCSKEEDLTLNHSTPVGNWRTWRNNLNTFNTIYVCLCQNLKKSTHNHLHDVVSTWVLVLFGYNTKSVCLQRFCAIMVPRKIWWKHWLYTLQAIFHLTVWLHEACLTRMYDCSGAWFWKSLPKMIVSFCDLGKIETTSYCHKSDRHLLPQGPRPRQSPVLYRKAHMERHNSGQTGPMMSGCRQGLGMCFADVFLKA